MPWFRLETLARHDSKFRRVGPDAAWMWACCGMYCAEQETDGFVPADELPFICNWGKPDGMIARLVKAGLLEVKDGGYVVHNYLKYNLSRADSVALRSKRAAAGRAGALSRARQASNTCSTSVEQAFNKTSDRIGSGSLPSSSLPPEGGGGGSQEERSTLAARIAREHLELLRSLRDSKSITEDAAGAVEAEPFLRGLSNQDRTAVLRSFVSDNDKWLAERRWALRWLNAARVNQYLTPKPADTKSALRGASGKGEVDKHWVGVPSGEIDMKGGK